MLNPESKPPAYAAATLDVTPSVSDLNYYIGWDFEAFFTDYALWFPASAGRSNLTCVVYNSTYHLNYTFVGSTTSVAIDQIVRQQPASQLSPANGSDGIFLPNSMTHSAWFNATTNYYAVLSSMYSYLVGNITVADGLNAANFVYMPPSIFQ
jgi:hypothetical protein